MGIGDGVISVDQAVPSPLAGAVGGGTRWQDDETIVYQRKVQTVPVEAYVIESLHLPTGARVELLARGANVIVAGGGQWATWSSAFGYLDSHPSDSRQKAWYPLAVDDLTGRIAVCLDYQSATGLGIWDGTTLDTLDVRLTSLEACFKDSVLCFQAGPAHLLEPGRLRSLPDLPVSGVEFSRGYWLVWSTLHQAVCLVREGETLGRVISRSGRDFNARLRVIDGVAFIASSSGQGEYPNELQRYEIVLDSAGEVVDLAVPPASAVVVPDFAKVSQRCAVLVDGAAGVPWFADTGEWKDEELGVLWDTKQQDQKQASEDLAEDTDRILYVYPDKPEPTVQDFQGISETVTWLPLAQCYPLNGESDADFDARVRRTFQMLTDAYGRFAVYACGFLGIDSPEGARTEQQVLNGLAIVNRAAADFPNCRMVVVFTETRGAADGVARFATIQEAVRRFQSAVPDAADYPTVAELAPDVPPVTPPDPPKPEPPDPPKPVLTEQEFLIMNVEAPRPATTLIASHFKPGGFDGRFLYPMTDDQGKPVGNLALDSNGNLTTSPNTGPGESWLWVKGSGKARIESVNFAFTFTVDESR